MAQHVRYRAPTENGRKLIVPPWNELGSLVSANSEWRSRADLQIAGQSLAAFSSAARRELLACARAYVTAYSPAFSATGENGISDKPVIVTGHQPDLVHPGVWVKNFAAGALARSLGGSALNLVIDADACRSMTVRVPSGTIESPRFASVEFDIPGEVVPWEERSILDHRCWNTFPQRVREATESLLNDRMLDDWWPRAIDRADATGRIGASLAQARHLAELEWKEQSLEMPQSQMCRSQAFRLFVCDILRDLPRFVDAYNGVLAEYRRAHHIRNHAHPVSNLQQHDQWLQAPLWCWTADAPRRRAVYVRQTEGRWVVSDLQSFERPLPLSSEDRNSVVIELERWEADGLKLRSRALLTTMFARLAVADLFIHGIGGAKYDEVTDAICERFFHTVPPPHATISGTLRLPIAYAAGRDSDVGQFRQALRELDYHPERSVEANQGWKGQPAAAATELIDAKFRWIRTPKTPANASARHAAITSVNRALQSYVAEQRAQLETELVLARARGRANRILASREYAFCLYPQRELGHFLLDFGGEAL